MVLEELGHALQLLNGFGAFQLHQFMPVAGFHPADAEVRHQKANEVLVAQISHKGGSLAIAAVVAYVAGGCKTSFFETAGQGLKAHHQVIHHRAVLLSQALKHGTGQETHES